MRKIRERHAGRSLQYLLLLYNTQAVTIPFVASPFSL